jgi:tetratricopeptide (TPR) repeat protein
VNRHGEDPAWLDSALVAAQRAIALDSELPAGYHTLGTAHLIAGRGDDALPALERALELDPSSASATMNLAILHGLAGRLDQAARWLNRALTIEPAWAGTVLHNLAVVYRDLGMAARAREANERSLLLQPDDPFANSMRVGLTMRAGDFDQAIAMAERLTAANPTDATAWVFAGEVHLHAGGCELARSRFERAHRYAPLADGTVAYVPVLLGHCLWQTGDRERAVALFEKFTSHAAQEIAIGSRPPALLNSVVAVHAVRGERAEAVQRLSQAIVEGRDTWVLDHDPLLEPLRADSAFQQVAAGLRSTVAEMRAPAFLACLQCGLERL